MVIPRYRGWKVIVTVSRDDGGKVTLGAVAFDIHSGEVAWKQDLFTPDAAEVRKRHSKNGLASATPFIKEGVAYVHFGHMGSAAP